MRKRLSHSLSVKVFFLVFAILACCSMVIYGIVITVIPQRYQAVMDMQFSEDTNTLFASLNNKTYDEATDIILNFCIQNNAVAELMTDEDSVSFGSLPEVEKEIAVSQAQLADITLSDKDEDYMLLVRQFSDTAHKILNVLLTFIPVILLVIVLLSVLCAFLCSRIIVAPIKKIDQISKRMAGLDMTWRCEVKRKDEVGSLAENLNIMAERLQKAMSELEIANRQLMADVEKFQFMEKQRRNFFVAVSHELKTPLTILKGQIENMILGYGDYQNRDKYLPQALKTTEEMEYLVREILSITKMETMRLGDTLERVSLSEMLSRLVEEIAPLAARNHISIHQDYPASLSIRVNRNLFQKALSNIIGNAVRHSPAGAEVFINFDVEQNVLTVENTKANIDEDKLAQLFTPFYRTDKSRNKSTGGSGLGLYIVKTILDLHGLKYGIENTSRGVAFHLQITKEDDR